MFAHLAQIDVEIADIEQMILLKNQAIVSALQKGTDTICEEKQVGLLNKALQAKKGSRRKLVTELRSFGGALPTGRCPLALIENSHSCPWALG
jgi:hypothetical protein